MVLEAVALNLVAGIHVFAILCKQKLPAWVLFLNVSTGTWVNT